MKTNNLRKGFTLIELLVVIVIIGILATIGVATFQGYFAKARDTERLSAIANIGTMLKADQAAADSADYSHTDAEVNAIVTAQGYAVPSAKNSYEYYLAYLTADGSEFAVYACSEGTKDDNLFIRGTTAGMATVNAIDFGVTGLCLDTPDGLDGTAGAVTNYTIVKLDPAA